MLVEYIRDNQGRKRGMFVGSINTNTGLATVGWSLCNKKDTFDRDRAFEIAFGRASCGRRGGPGFNYGSFDGLLPSLVNKRLKSFVERCHRYYNLEIQVAV